ncbi:hypothetical protein, partial [Kluyvera intermedia]|uniref:hypothetical protein n=1 Tax=Kluyvera intermedia TaxID=61648 RepID=UPI0035269A0D
MNKYIISIVLVYSATSLSVNAALTGNDLAAANAYFKAHPEIIVYAPWIRDNVMNANNLESANNTLIKNTYYNGSGVIDVQQIPAWIPPVTTSPPLYNVAEQSSKTEVSYRPATSQPNHSEINASAMKLAQAQQEQKLVNTAVITNNNVNASAMKLAQTQQEQKLVNTAVITNNNVNASAMKLAQAQQEQKLVNTAVITNNNVNASAMKLAQTQQEQKLVNTAVITNNNANASAMKLAQAQQEQKLVNTAVITNNNVNASAMKLAQAQQEQKLVNTAVITN